MVIRVQSGSLQLHGRRIRAAPAGTPDLVVLCHGGVTIWLEVKLPSGKVLEKQLEVHEQMRTLGHLVSVVRSVQEALEVCCGI